MYNLFLGIDKINRDEWAVRLAEMRVYNTNYVWRNVFLYIYWLLTVIFAKISKRNIPEKPASMSALVSQERRNIQSMNDNSFRMYFVNVILRKNRCKIDLANDDDYNSTIITKKASRYIRSAKIRGLSPDEVNQYIHKNQPAANYSPKKYIGLYKILTLFVLLIGLVMPFVLVEHRRWGEILVVISLLALKIFFDYKIKANNLLSIVWLAVSGTNRRRQIEEEDNSGRKELEELFRGVHTLNMLISQATADIDSYNKTINSKNRIIAKNKNLIEQSENQIVIKDKQQENNELSKDIQQIQFQINKCRNNCTMLMDNAGNITSQIVDRLGRYWNMKFPKIKLQNDTMSGIVHSFAYGDLDVIEKRYREFDRTSSPEALTKKEGKTKYIEFRTMSSGIGRFDVVFDKDIIYITKVYSQYHLKEAWLTLDQLDSIIRKWTQPAAGNINSEIIDSWRKKVEDLENQLNDQNVWHLYEKRMLSNRMDEIRKEREQAEQSILKYQEQYDETVSLLIEKESELADAEDELRNLQNSVSASKDEIQSLQSNCESLRNDIELRQKKVEEYRHKFLQAQDDANRKEIELQNEIQRVKKETEDRILREQRKFEEDKRELVKSLEAKNRKIKENDEKIASLQGSISSAENSIVQSQAIIDRLNEQIKKGAKLNPEAQKSYDKLQENLKNEKNRRKYAEKQRGELEKEKNKILNEKKDIQVLYNNARIKNSEMSRKNEEFLSQIKDYEKRQSETVIYIKSNQEIVDSFYNMIENAQKEVFMIFPFISYEYKKKKRDKSFEYVVADVYKRTIKHFDKAFERNPNLIMHIWYGLSDNMNSKKTREKVQMTARAREAYEKRYGQRIVFHQTNTHMKIVVADDNAYMYGSMNLLSSADWIECPKMHSESAFLSYDKEQIRKIKNSYF